MYIKLNYIHLEKSHLIQINNVFINIYLLSIHIDNKYGCNNPVYIYV